MYFPVGYFTIPPNINGQFGKKKNLFQWGKNKVTVDIAGFLLDFSSATISVSSVSFFCRHWHYACGCSLPVALTLFL